MTELEDWLTCPRCNDSRVSVKRITGDRGGTEMLKLDCDNCGSVKTVVP